MTRFCQFIDWHTGYPAVRPTSFTIRIHNKNDGLARLCDANPSQPDQECITKPMHTRFCSRPVFHATLQISIFFPIRRLYVSDVFSTSSLRIPFSGNFILGWDFALVPFFLHAIFPLTIYFRRCALYARDVLVLALCSSIFRQFFLLHAFFHFSRKRPNILKLQLSFRPPAHWQ